MVQLYNGMCVHLGIVIQSNQLVKCLVCCIAVHFLYISSCFLAIYLLVII